MIRILLFAELEEVVGKREIELSDEEISVGEIREKLEKQYPDLHKIRSAMAAVNEEYAENTVLAHEGDLVAFIPPVSGG
ncbi:molybdopterin converting factor subunit 1 [Salipaludibacillus keqinensis]|uniref:Molybdopterin synthase sulfur carrier subunit n=1 Tax=Salipaludibacillus keqinensis TaxID=2045207 RepID=A0A323TGE4_9BACI|nr:molybdopterin converting factor subunit 1 [Salipaludibacillus keqinensis]PYZ93540.1 molybdopterin converting factor subunit 1 [Salipaludibacillus keqinensis]